MTNTWRRYAQCKENRNRICILRGSSHKTSNSLARGLFCPNCRTPYLDCEAQRVKVAVDRAQRRGLPATLTILEWLRIVDHFEHRCAYCHAPFQVLEHVIAINNGGETTKLNCVPGCLSCNRRKDHSLTEDPLSLEKIEQIKQELQCIFSLQ